jgi:hypothetical protein
MQVTMQQTDVLLQQADNYVVLRVMGVLYSLRTFEGWDPNNHSGGFRQVVIMGKCGSVAHACLLLA